MNVIQERQRARQDLVEIFRYYVLMAGLAAARHFRARAEATFLRLAQMPGMGTLYNPDESLYADLRYFPISRFPKYIIFYPPIEGGVEVIRVLHGTRDLDRLLAEDFNIDPNAPDEDQ